MWALTVALDVWKPKCHFCKEWTAVTLTSSHDVISSEHTANASWSWHTYVGSWEKSCAVHAVFLLIPPPLRFLLLSFLFSWRISSWKRFHVMLKHQMSSSGRWTFWTNPLSPLCVWLRPQHWVASLRSRYQQGTYHSCLPFGFSPQFSLISLLTVYCNRFLFILLGPHGKTKSYNEIGRAIATLMVDDVSDRHLSTSTYW